MENSDDNDPLREPEPEPGLVTRRHPELQSESDDGLVTYMAFKTTDEELARDACDELHRRHAHFLLSWCIKRRKETFGNSAEDFVNATFFKAYREAASFVCTDQGQSKEQVLAWLFRILKNLYLDSLRAEKRRPVVRSPDGTTEWLEGLQEKQQKASEQVPVGRKAKVLEFFETLSPKDQEILMVTAEFWDPDRGEPVIDDDIRQGICKDYGLTDSSLRVRRKRLKDHGKVFIQEQENKNETKNQINGTYEGPAESQKPERAVGR